MPSREPNPDPAIPPLLVLNPGGRDAWREFPQGAGQPTDPGHPPVNFHAYAACTRGIYADRIDPRHFTAGRSVLLLLRRDLRACERALDELLKRKCIVAVSLKETGSSQLAQLLVKPKLLATFRRILGKAHGAIAATEYLEPFYRGFLPGNRPSGCVQFIPTPYPVGEEGWYFSVPIPERRGIMIGTREFRTASRGHLAALVSLLPLAQSEGTPITVVNTEKKLGRQLLAELPFPAGKLKIVEGRRPYPEYLRDLARHKFVYQLDASTVPGQVAGDCLLAGIPCVGGNGAVESVAFSFPQPPAETADILTHEPDAYAAACAESQRLAREQLSFPAIAPQLTEYFTRLRT